MEKKHRFFYLLLLVSTLAIVCLATVFYIRQLNKTISANITSFISEIALHDKSAIQSYIETCWEDLQEIRTRFDSHECKTIEDLQTQLHLECASGGFAHIYLIAEDGTVYTDHYTVHAPDNGSEDPVPDFLSCFANGRQKGIARFDGILPGSPLPKENILYGIRLDRYEVDGVNMAALVGINDISTIQDNMVIDSFIRNGESLGHSALIDRNGNYIVNINKEIYLNERNNLFEHLAEAESSELTNAEVQQRFRNLETFGFYHSHAEEKHRELFYFIPFGNEMDLYFIMSVNEIVFTEQTRTFVAMSMAMLVVCILAIIIMLPVVLRLKIKAIRASEKAKSQKEFLSNMSHEIRTPLNGLIGINHLIMMNIDDDAQKPQIREWLQKSHSTANYLLSLVNDILDISKLQAGKVDLVHEPLLVSALVDEIAAMQADNIRSRGVSFTVEKDLPVPCIEGDPTHLKQILMNIVGNAAKFTPAGKSVRFSVRQEKTDDLHVTTFYQCEDTGIGISPEYIDKIFDAFSQERNRNTSGIKGTGLGMAISKLLVTAMGGDISVQSELNVGSTFTVSIPSAIIREIPDSLKASVAQGSCTEETAVFDPIPGNRLPKILVAEDVELNAEILMEILRMEGFEAVHASNGKEALDLFARSEIGEFGIILMDMQMPVMDGCSASMKIRKLDRADAKTVRILACTANTFQEDRTQALNSGMNDFLSKPVDISALIRKMKNK